MRYPVNRSSQFLLSQYHASSNDWHHKVRGIRYQAGLVSFGNVIDCTNHLGTLCAVNCAGIVAQSITIVIVNL